MKILQSKWLNLWNVTLFLALGGTIAIHAYPGFAQKPSSNQTAARNVRSAALVSVDKVQLKTIAQTFPIIGRLVPRKSGIIASRVAAPVAQMKADVGDRIEEGDIIAILVRDQLYWRRERGIAEVASRRAQLRGRKADLIMKNQEMRRLEKLRANKSAAHRKSKFNDMRQRVVILESAVAQAAGLLKQSEADAQLAEINLSYTLVRSPFSGVVTQRHTNIGAYLNVGQPVITLIDDSVLEIEAEVPSNRAANLLPSTEVVATTGKHIIRTSVRAVVPEENLLTQTRTVRFKADNESLPIGLAGNQSVTLAIPLNNGAQVISVHKDAILKRRGNNMVFVVENGAAQPRRVSIGSGVGDRFVVRQGLKLGDVVVIRGNERLFPGQSVRF